MQPFTTLLIIMLLNKFLKQIVTQFCIKSEKIKSNDYQCLLQNNNSNSPSLHKKEGQVSIFHFILDAKTFSTNNIA